MEAKMSAAKEEADEKRKKLIEEGKLVEGSEEDVKMLEEASKAQGTLAKTASAEMQLGQTETISVNGEQKRNVSSGTEAESKEKNEKETGRTGDDTNRRATIGSFIQLSDTRLPIGTN
eukprot:1194246-Prorocentrum_minimum.AAC.1